MSNRTFLIRKKKRDVELDLLKSLTSDKEENNEDNELYAVIPPPRPLIEIESSMNHELKTVFNLKFKKLPQGIIDENKMKNPGRPEIEYKEDSIVKSKIERPKTSIKTSENQKQPIHKYLQNLYSLGDKMEIFRKFAHPGDYELEPRIYSSYTIDLTKYLSNRKKPTVQYLENIQDPEMTLRATIHPDELDFDSSFESGNLYAAYKINDNEYDLILQNDYNTKGYTQWFFFAVRNTKKDQVVKFNIVNFMKNGSLYSEGMKPCVFSEISSANESEDWVRDGFDIKYKKNDIIREGYSYLNWTYYTLSFSYKFRNKNDTVYFANCYPYTYTTLSNYLNSIVTNPETKKFVKRRILCHTISKNVCEFITITSDEDIDNFKSRLGIVIIGRQHPGEPMSSIMLQGLIDFLLSDCDEAKFLRKYCIFRIIPMINPDGVIHGNHRTCLPGSDLNRRWKKPNQTIHPTVFHAKEMIKEFSTQRKLAFIFDLHGHSRMKNAFIYGNEIKDNPYSTRLYPYMLSKISKYIKFDSCRFAVQKDKEATARISLWREFNIPNIFTVEASFFGYSDNNKMVHFSQEDYYNIGSDICKTLYLYLLQHETGDLRISKDGSIRKRSSAGNQSQNAFVVQCLEELKKDKYLIDVGNKPDDSGSESNPSEDELLPDQLVKILPKKFVEKKKVYQPVLHKHYVETTPKFIAGSVDTRTHECKYRASKKDDENKDSYLMTKEFVMVDREILLDDSIKTVYESGLKPVTKSRIGKRNQELDIEKLKSRRWHSSHDKKVAPPVTQATCNIATAANENNLSIISTKHGEESSNDQKAVKVNLKNIPSMRKNVSKIQEYDLDEIGYENRNSKKKIEPQKFWKETNDTNAKSKDYILTLEREIASLDSEANQMKVNRKKNIETVLQEFKNKQTNNHFKGLKPRTSLMVNLLNRSAMVKRKIRPPSSRPANGLIISTEKKNNTKFESENNNSKQSLNQTYTSFGPTNTKQNFFDRSRIFRPILADTREDKYYDDNYTVNSSIEDVSLTLDQHISNFFRLKTLQNDSSEYSFTENSQEFERRLLTKLYNGDTDKAINPYDPSPNGKMMKSFKMNSANRYKSYGKARTLNTEY